MPPLPLYSGGEGRGEGAEQNTCLNLKVSQGMLNPLTPDPSPPEYRGRGEKTRNMLTSNNTSVRALTVSVISLRKPIWLHLRRAFSWDLRRVAINAAEEKLLAGHGITNPTLQRYLVWRRSVLLVLCLPIFLVAVFETVDDLDDFSWFSAFGSFWMILQLVIPYAVAAAVAFAARN